MSSTWQISASTETLRRLNGELFGFFYKRLNQTEDAQDLVSKTWIGAGRTYRRLSSLRHFMFRVAYNILTDYWRQQRRRPPPDAANFEDHHSTAPGPESTLTAAEWRRTADRALNHVPFYFRGVLELWLRGFSYKEIAEALAMNPNTVRSQLARGRKHFFAALPSTAP